MAVFPGAHVADFEQDSTLGRIHFPHWADADWVLVLGCPSTHEALSQMQLGAAARLEAAFAARRVKVLAHSNGSLSHHLDWLAAIETAHNVSVEFPILADVDASAARALGLGGPPDEARVAMLVDPDRVVRAVCAYPAHAALSFDEVFRLLDALCPAGG
jgi:alkyl hydroperoxide reductase subunit AhpC